MKQGKPANFQENEVVAIRCNDWLGYLFTGKETFYLMKIVQTFLSRKSQMYQ